MQTNKNRIVDLNYRPRQWQLECHKKLKRFSVLVLHRRAGKSELAIMHLLDRALKFDKELGLFTYVAPYLKQAKAIAWARLKQRVEPLRISGAVEVNESELFLRFNHNKAMIRVIGADNPHAIRGVRLDGSVIDEVAQIKPETWIDIIQPALSDRKGWGMFIGTPNGVNLFSELYYRAIQDPEWFAAKYTVYDTNAISADEVERLKASMSEASFAREFLCDFSAAGDDQVISLADVEAGAQRKYQERDVSYAPKILGIDPARFGDDKSVIFPRQGLQAFTPLIYRGIDNMDFASRIASKIDEWNPDAVFIDAGNGAGVIDRLRQLGHRVIEVNFASSPIKPQFLNKRAEIWWETRDWLKAGGAIPNLVELKQDLATPTYWYSNTNKIQLEPKDEIKKRGLPSPDLGDALALTFAQPVAPTPVIGTQPAGRHIADYDPFK